MNKKFLACLLAGTMVFGACGVMTAAEDTTEAAEGTASGEELSDDIYSFQVKINGELYAFPMTYADFVAKGWTYQGDEDMELSPNSYTSETFSKDYLKIYVDVFNLGLNTVNVTETMVGGFSVDSYQMEDETDTTFELPKGITYGVSTLDDIKAAYGEPSDVYEGELYTKVSYEYDSYQDIELYVDVETGVLNEIDLRNFVYDAEANAAAAADVSSDPTEAVLAYEAPAELSDKLFDYTVDFAGNLYQLPAPVSVFLANGWTIKPDDTDSVVAGKDSGWVTMMKDNQELRALARNYDANATVIENCFVREIEASIYGPKLPITLSNGITLDSTVEELEAALDAEGIRYDKVTDSDSYTIYNIEDMNDSSDGYQFITDNETSTMRSISLECHQTK